MRNGGQTLPQAAAQPKPAGPAEHMRTVGIKYNIQSKRGYLVCVIIASVLKFRFSVKITEIWKNLPNVFTSLNMHFNSVGTYPTKLKTFPPDLNFTEGTYKDDIVITTTHLPARKITDNK